MAPEPLIFLSHSSSDQKVAEEITDLLLKALPVNPEEIRCTTAGGCKLPAGAAIDEQLRREVNSCKVLVGLISPHGISSAYVLFELGARWGSGKRLIPILAGGDADLLRGPLRGLHALRCDNEADLHGLISELAEAVDRPQRRPEVFLQNLKRVAETATSLWEETSKRQDLPRDLALELSDNHNKILSWFTATGYRPLPESLGLHDVQVRHLVTQLVDWGLLQRNYDELGDQVEPSLTAKGDDYVVSKGLLLPPGPLGPHW